MKKITESNLVSTGVLLRFVIAYLFYLSLKKQHLLKIKMGRLYGVRKI